MDQNALWSIFRRIDKNGSGNISADELQSCLSNGLGTMFNIRTVQLMMSMFDSDMNGTISFDEFGKLFKYVNDWQNCFRQFDRDNSGSIDRQELSTALMRFGYNLSPQFINFMILTGAFRRYDYRMIGQAQFSFEQFLAAAFSVVI
ncbi:programmed cell death protein, putative [Schistosoma mansoni]|uniref:programmed cell death protein, putative n=1 Tax=Schistosoma mansoni TaxID=6183 RepID=UPI0001A62BC3|nr:programmed cell death protein, putative [Schistosoma mansoni]|eukprot:XP_018646550.1 programmed cell death protein, putative [Schistosoma mansoni]